MSLVAISRLWVRALIVVLVCGDVYAAGSSKPPENPFESAAGLGVEDWAKNNQSLLLNVLATSNIASKLGPCGCSTNPKGGVDRRYNFIETQKNLTGYLLQLDAGNSLFASRNLDASMIFKQQERAKKMSIAQRDLGVEAQNVGAYDLASGVEFVVNLGRTTGLNFISSNIQNSKDGGFPFKTHFIKELKGAGKVLVLGFTSPEDTPPAGFRILEPEAILKSKIQEFKPSVTLVLSDMGQVRDMRLLENSNMPIMVIGSRELGAIDIPVHAGSGFMIQPGIQGQQISVARLALGSKFNSWRNVTQENALSRRWNQLLDEYKYISSQEGSKEKKLSIEKIKETFEELSKYAKNDAKTSWPYAYEIYDMDERYAQKNKFTKLALEDQ